MITLLGAFKHFIVGHLRNVTEINIPWNCVFIGHIYFLTLLGHFWVGVGYFLICPQFGFMTLTLLNSMTLL